MTAYELADELHEDLQWIVTSNTDLTSRLASAINMLRQQADRIAELEKQTFFIADPEKQGEPVAWMDEHENVIFEKNWAYPIPLYTSLVFCTAQQTKPLSDEEICNLWLENSYGLPLCNIAFEYAKAIEERHWIK